ncbi:MAG: hypothetical protein CM1200mP30_02340 [Pseudomonadota bacterium]|nr:MAG: hypothetical protein CM1200mP30_02340 [Pseudomonadota bacterium]
MKLNPGLFVRDFSLGFTALSFINGFICFGSFEQVEYLAGFKQKWLNLIFWIMKLYICVTPALLQADAAWTSR